MAFVEGSRMQLFVDSFRKHKVALLLWLCLAQSTLALPVGQWRSDFYGAYGSINITDNRFDFALEEPESKWSFGGPIAKVVEPLNGAPGKIVVGPIDDGDPAWEVIWFYPPNGPRALFFRESTGFATQAEAEASQTELKPNEASMFLSREFFAECDALPVLPEPDKAQLVLLLHEALKRLEADRGSDINTLMETLMIDKGFHPTKSREPFESALNKYGDDPEVSPLIAKLES